MKAVAKVRQVMLPKKIRRSVLGGAAPESLVKGADETENQALNRIETKYLARAVTPLKAIRAKCVQCQGGQVKQIAKCEVKTCALWPFRMEHNPFNRLSKKPMGL